MCAAALVGGSQFGSHSGEDAGRWARAGQANLAGWAVYKGRTQAGGDLADAVLDANLDIVGVAEARERQLNDAARRLAKHGPVQVLFQRTISAGNAPPWGAQSDDESVYGIGLLARGPVKLNKTTVLELPTVDGRAGEVDIEEDRWVLCARTSSRHRHIDDVRVCITHFTRLQVSVGRRRYQAQYLADRLSSLVADGTPVIVLADLNARQGDLDLNPLYDLGLADIGEGASRDHVLISSLRHGALRSATLGRSDHKIVWAPIGGRVHLQQLTRTPTAGGRKQLGSPSHACLVGFLSAPGTTRSVASEARACISRRHFRPRVDGRS